MIKSWVEDRLSGSLRLVFIILLGIWRVFNLFQSRGIPVTIFAVAMAIERHPEIVEVALENKFEICSHGWRWIDYQYIPAEIEREHMNCDDIIELYKN